MKRSVQWAVIVAGPVLVLAAGFLGGRAWAGGIPAKGALTYSGVLQKQDGSPLSSPGHNLEIKLWSTGSTGGTALCSTIVPAPEFTLDAGGRFSVQLNDTCTGAIGANPGAFVEIVLDGNTLGRTKLGAVPYAIEANHAATADSAAGPLQTTVDGLKTAASYSAARLGPAADPAVAMSWAMYHAAAVGACVALTPPAPTGEPGRVYVQGVGLTCAQVCAAQPRDPVCRGGAAVGDIALARLTPGAFVGLHYIYTCDNAAAGTREAADISPGGGQLFSYCCCSG
jgi:hypothetical protein